MNQKEFFDMIKEKFRKSKKWIQWVTRKDPKTCQECWDADGKVIDKEEANEKWRCILLPLPVRTAVGAACRRGYHARSGWPKGSQKGGGFLGGRRSHGEAKLFC